MFEFLSQLCILICFLIIFGWILRRKMVLFQSISFVLVILTSLLALLHTSFKSIMFGPLLLIIIMIILFYSNVKYPKKISFQKSRWFFEIILYSGYTPPNHQDNFSLFLNLLSSLFVWIIFFNRWNTSYFSVTPFMIIKLNIILDIPVQFQTTICRIQINFLLFQ